MWLSLVENFILGFAMSAIPGTILVETIRRELLDKKSLYKFMVGNFVGVLLIVASIFSGLAIIIDDRSTAGIFYGICGVLLIYLGVSSILAKQKNHNHKKIVKKVRKSPYAAFSTGLLLTIMNPVTILIWISIIGKIMQDTHTISIYWAVANSVSAVIGSRAFYIILVMIINVLHIKISTNHLIVLSRIFGVVLLIYGFVTLSKIV